MAKRIQAPNPHVLQAKERLGNEGDVGLVARNVYSLCKGWGEGITYIYAIPIKDGVESAVPHGSRYSSRANQSTHV
jgi:hypothetical protein